MGRILPRLLARIPFEPQSWSPFVLPRRKLKSLYRSVPPRPSFHPARHLKSILLREPDTNPITSSRTFLRHKTLPPLLHQPRRVKHPQHDHDRPRAMTEQERQWWSSPYLRMLASPIRQCIATERYMPSDFLVRLAPMRLPSSLPRLNWARTGSVTQTLIPDGLQHPKFTARKSGKASYILCNRAAVSVLADPGSKRRASIGINIYPHLADHIAHLLRLRVLQELELLVDNLSALPRPPILKTRLIRRLSRADWDALRTTGTIPYPGAVAVLVVPPLQKDPATKQRPQPSMSPAPLKPEDTPPAAKNALLPLCTLHPVGPPAWDPEVGDGILPQAKVPLYNGVTLFPARSQRAALHALLTRLLGIERVAPHFIVKETSTEQDGGRRASHAFLLCSNPESVLRGDVTAVAIALWRIRIFEDQEEDVASQRMEGWERTRR
ncbi:hypothetical protein D9615_000254 [Tricholomella constricta]|uniref:Uncharacterized protein n=1 Tax=Tricholomella constricta TaxID=117010 RepID=A0A8H5HSI0_9AGAR|nr:hypothetical protein D9615_000254 [Tricholomella constricta]